MLPPSFRTALAAFASAVVSVLPAVARAQDGVPIPGEEDGELPVEIAPAPASPAERVVMPKLREFVNAEYPPEALAAGLEGDVVLELTIAATGDVTSAIVVEPAGHGFDGAAQAAALKFRFEPATLDGVAVPVKLLYRYRFTLSDQPGAPAEAGSVPPGEGAATGRVAVGTTEVPVVGARVVATSESGAVFETTTDAAGAWSFQALPPGKYVVTVSAPGFETSRYALEVTAGEGTELALGLDAAAKPGDVVVHGVRPPRSMTKRTLQRREMTRIPGTSGDALRALESQPGVARAPGFAGLIIVRGSSPRDTQTFIDGTPVPLIYHFGGLASVVPTEMLERIDFHPGNFSAVYGRVMGAIVDVALRSPDTSCFADYGLPSEETGCYHGLAQVDLLEGRLMLQGPLPLERWSFAVAGRRSWFDTWLGPVLEASGANVTTAPVYYDYQAIIEGHPGGKRNDLSLRFYGSSDALELIVTQPSAQEPGFAGEMQYGTVFWRAQGLFRSRLTKDVSLEAMLSYGLTQVQLGVGDIEFDVTVHPVELRSELAFRLSELATLDAGLDFLVQPYNVHVRAPSPPRPGEPAPGPFSLRPLQTSDDDGYAFQPAYFLEAEVTPTPRLRIVPGVRLDYNNDTDAHDLNPRVNARYAIIEGGAGPNGEHLDETVIKAGIGVYSQPPQPQETDEVFGSPGLESNRAVHYSLGVEQDVGAQIDVDVEAFYKTLSNLVSRTQVMGGYEYGNLGSGDVIGVEALVQYQPDEQFFGWIAYTLSKSVRQDGPGLDEYMFQFDQTHNLTLLGSYRLGHGWEFGARFRLVSGALVTPVLAPPGLQSIYSSDTGSYTALTGEPFSERLPLFHQLDVRIDRRWQFRSWRIAAFLDVRNVYNNAAKEALVYNFDFTQESYQVGLPILPSLGVRGEF